MLATRQRMSGMTAAQTNEATNVRKGSYCNGTRQRMHAGEVTALQAVNVVQGAGNVEGDRKLRMCLTWTGGMLLIHG
jgi:hypothetical protein